MSQSGTRQFYDLDSAPAYWDPPDLPRIVHRDGESVCYELGRFLQEATSITEEQFEAMKRVVCS